MADITLFLLIVLLVLFFAKVILFLLRRLTVLHRLLALRKIEGVTVTVENPLALFSPRMTKKPFASVALKRTVYPIFLLNGGGVFRWMHFANEEYLVAFSRMRGGRTPRDAVSGNPTAMHTLSVGGHTEILPKIETRKGEKPILLISPLPGNLTYVAENKTSIHVAFTGDEFYGRKVFAIRSFCRYIDRESRKNDAPKIFFE